MSQKRLIEETLCDHGEERPHYLPHDDHYGPHVLDNRYGPDCPRCPGGSSREITVDRMNWEVLYDYMVEEFSIDDTLSRHTFLVHAYDMEKAALGGGMK